MDQFREEIIKAIKKEVKDAEITLEVPPNPELGDYAFPCFSLAKIYKKNPADIAKDLALKIKKSKFISEIKVIGPYLNFFINKDSLTGGTLKEILRKK
ncbi:MAG: arginine--tRNA ligase, partial [Nanoarchaeota archaeon]